MIGGGIRDLDSEDKTRPISVRVGLGTLSTLMKLKRQVEHHQCFHLHTVLVLGLEIEIHQIVLQVLCHFMGVVGSFGNTFDSSWDGLLY